mgnify:FL=1
MRTYSVHIRRHGLDFDRDVVVVKEGFSWPACLFNIFWALWHRHWLAAIALFMIPLGIAIITNVIGLAPAGQTALSMGWSVIVGMLANDVRRYYLDRDGFVEDGITAGKSPDDALYDYLRDTATPPTNTSGYMI